MNYEQTTTTDASYLYRPTTEAGSGRADGTAAPGNLADLMRHGTLVRGTFVLPPIVQVNDPVPDTHVRG